MKDARVPAKVPYLDPEIVRQARTELAAIRREPWFRPGEWSVSRHNFAAQAMPPALVPKRVTFVELTGRLIEQLPGVALATDEKLAVIKAISEAGVEQVHVAFQFKSPSGKAHMKAVIASGLHVKAIASCYTDEDIPAAAESGAHIAEILSHAVAGMSGTYTGKRVPTQDELLLRTTKRVRHAKSLGMEVRADVNIVSYVDLDYLGKFAAAVKEAGADYINLCDSTGGLGPKACALLVKTVREAAPTLAIGLHLHNDFGLALTSALAGLEAGAEVFDVSIHGIGEQAGQVDLAQLALVLHVFYGIETGVKFDRLTDLSKLVQDLTRMPLPPFTPIFGAYAFDAALESAQKRVVCIDPYDHIPIAPEFVGGRRSIHLGRYTGPFSALWKAEQLGFEIAEDRVPALMAELDDWYVARKRAIDDHELVPIFMKYGWKKD